MLEERPGCACSSYFTSYVLNMLRTLIYPSSGACDCVVELLHRSSCSVNTDDLTLVLILRCIVVCVWCDVFCRLVVVGSGQNQLKYTYQLQQSDKTHHTKHTPLHTVKFTLTLNHPSLQNKTTDVVMQQHSRKLLMMDILMSETCWTHKK